MSPTPALSAADEQGTRDRRLLALSVWACVGFAGLSTAWGVATGSSMIVFDGLYSLVSVGLSTLALVALRFVRRGADDRYPWGREAAEPLVVVLKAATLAALCLYAAVGGVADLLRGGRPVEAGWAVLYAVIATAAGAGVGLTLRRGSRAPGASDLVRAEAAEWLGDALLSMGVLVGFLVALALVRAGREDVAAYVDPTMVVVVSLAFLVVPARLVTGGLREVMSMSPPEAVLERLRECVARVEKRYRFRQSVLRAAKVGGRLDVEVDFVVGPGSPVVTVADCDEVRADLYEELAALGYERSLVVSFTTDPRWTE